jgi:hypothetical protein
MLELNLVSTNTNIRRGNDKSAGEENDKSAGFAFE